jgi:hypothetical protein
VLQSLCAAGLLLQPFPAAATIPCCCNHFLLQLAHLSYMSSLRSILLDDMPL